jgi:peptidoglycan hydrolase-like protein with peptidoglycan-binding domain
MPNGLDGVQSEQHLRLVERARPVSKRSAGAFGGVMLVGLLLCACSTAGQASNSTGSTATTAGKTLASTGSTTPTTSTPTTSTPTTSTPTTSTPTTSPAPTTTTTIPPKTTTTAPPAKTASLQEGSTGAAVLALQQKLTFLGYWLGTPNGVFGDSTQEAVYAYQKAAGVSADGVVGPKTQAALAKNVRPTPKAFSGPYVIEVDLQDDLVMFVKNGTVEYILNCSTGGGYTYKDANGTSVATTPTGLFHSYRAVDGIVTDSLGQLWRPIFFTGGFAIHGDSYVPSIPVSHGCVRVSDEAIDWIWSASLDPLQTPVWVYS